MQHLETTSQPPELAASPETIQEFEAAVERYSYLTRIAIAKAVDARFILDVMDPQDRDLYIVEQDMDETEINECTTGFFNDNLDSAETRYTDGDSAETAFDQDMVDAIGVVDNYAVEFISRYGCVSMKSTEPRALPPIMAAPTLGIVGAAGFTHLVFGTEDGGEETDFCIDKYGTWGPLEIPLALEPADITTVEQTVHKLHATLSRISGVEEATRD